MSNHVKSMKQMDDLGVPPFQENLPLVYPPFVEWLPSLGHTEVPMDNPQLSGVFRDAAIWIVETPNQVSYKSIPNQKNTFWWVKISWTSPNFDCYPMLSHHLGDINRLTSLHLAGDLPIHWFPGRTVCGASLDRGHWLGRGGPPMWQRKLPGETCWGGSFRSPMTGGPKKRKKLECWYT